MGNLTSKKAPAQSIVTMPVIHPHAAGIDIGDKELVVAVPEGIAAQRVRTFGSMTCDLMLLAEWLKQCGINTVAMESTGVYGKPLFSVLAQEGFEVYLVNAANVKNVTGRKSDASNALWLQKLHSCGLLKSAYLPDDLQATLRTLVRYRRSFVQDSSRFVNRMQKSLELMNIKFHTVITDITGKTGKTVIEAILKGERKAENFLPLIDTRIKAAPQTIIQSLEGTFRAEHLFTLKESYEMYQVYQQRIQSCDQEIEKYLQHYEACCKRGAMQSKEPSEQKSETLTKARSKNRPRFKTKSYLEHIHGVDVLAIYGLSEIGAMELLAETGTDLSKWENEKHFVSWLNLCPNNKITGGKLISSN